MNVLSCFKLPFNIFFLFLSRKHTRDAETYVSENCYFGGAVLCCKKDAKYINVIAAAFKHF